MMNYESGENYADDKRVESEMNHAIITCREVGERVNLMVRHTEKTRAIRFWDHYRTILCYHRL